MTENDSSPILLTGASGFIGKRLLYRLDQLGYRVRCLTRKPEKMTFPQPLRHQPEVVVGDLLDPASLGKALDGIHTAYYLVHSMGGRSLKQMREFEARDRKAAENFVAAADRTGLDRLIYLGGLGDVTTRLSPHLASRQEVGRILAAGRVKATILRAAVIVGAGGAGFEMIRYLVERLPVMLGPKWLYTESQPIAIDNVLDYLTGCLTEAETAGHTFDIGGPEVLGYVDLMRLYARVRGLKRTIVPVPFFSTRLSAYWVALITPVPAGIVLPLAEGLKSTAVCREDGITRLIPLKLISMAQAVCNALAEAEKGPGRLLSQQACFLSDTDA